MEGGHGAVHGWPPRAPGSHRPPAPAASRPCAGRECLSRHRRARLCAFQQTGLRTSFICDGVNVLGSSANCRTQRALITHVTIGSRFLIAETLSLIQGLSIQNREIAHEQTASRGWHCRYFGDGPCHGAGAEKRKHHAGYGYVHPRQVRRDCVRYARHARHGQRRQRSRHAFLDMGPHMKMTTLRDLKPGDQEKADQVLEAARSSAEKYKDYRAALADGYKIFLPNLPQKQYHFTNYWYGFEAGTHFNPDHPTSLIYEKHGDDYKLIGVMYTAPKNSNEDELNSRIPLSIAQWHAHINMCMPPDDRKKELWGANAKF